MKKTFISILSISAIFILISTIYAYEVEKNLSGELIRLHIIANSDSNYDQNLKLKIRDRIIEQVGNQFNGSPNKNVLKKELTKKINEIKNIADNTLSDYNTGYSSHVSFEKLYIPRKNYNNIILPAGYYEAMVIRLGDAQGQNWWCIVYPPLCFTESTCGELSAEAKEYLKNNLTPQSYSLITENGIEIEYKLKIVELYEKTKQKLYSLRG